MSNKDLRLRGYRTCVNFNSLKSLTRRGLSSLFKKEHASGSAFVLTVSAICQKRNDSAVGQPADPQWTRCRRFPTAFPSPIARWRNLPRVAASPQLPTCLRLRPSGVVRPRNQSVPCSTAIENLPSPIQKTRAWALRLQPLYPEFPVLGLSPAWVR